MSSPQTDNTNARISAAADWLFATPSEMMPRPVIPWLMAEFGLTAREVYDAIMKSNRMREMSR